MLGAEGLCWEGNRENCPCRAHNLSISGCWRHTEGEGCVCAARENTWPEVLKSTPQKSSVTRPGTHYKCRWPGCPCPAEWEPPGWSPEVCTVTSLPGVLLCLKCENHAPERCFLAEGSTCHVHMNPNAIKSQIRGDNLNHFCQVALGGFDKLLTLSSLECALFPGNSTNLTTTCSLLGVWALVVKPGFSLPLWSTYSLYFYSYIFTFQALQNLASNSLHMS